MAETSKPEGPRPKKKGLLARMTPLLIGIVAGATGVGGGLYAMKPGVFAATAKSAPTEDTNAPKMVRREGAAGAHGAAAFQATYYPFQQPFTSNLKDSTQFVQLSVSLGTFYDETFVEKLKVHEMALRSAALLVIADQPYERVSSIDGKQALAAQLKVVLNKTLKERGEFPGIDTVYFTSFVVQ
jgi:flagellar protein FliL